MAPAGYICVLAARMASLAERAKASQRAAAGGGRFRGGICWLPAQQGSAGAGDSGAIHGRSDCGCATRLMGQYAAGDPWAQALPGGC